MQTKSLIILLTLYRITEIKSHTSFEYKPNNNLSTRPDPGNVLGKIFFSVAVKTAAHRISPRESLTEFPAQPRIVLEYNPIRPFHHSIPGNNIAQTDGLPEQPSLQGAPRDKFKETSSYNAVVQVRGLENTATPVAQERPFISLEYKPMRPPYAPNPGFFVGQIVEPGKPWPASPEDYENFNKPNPVQTTPKPLEVNTVLEYKPTRPSFHPNPGSNVGQVVPPGQPLPDRPGVQNFSQFSVNLEDRLQATNPSTVENIVAQEIQTTTAPHKQSSISLGYKPTRPSFHPNPGNNVGQVVPPGKPWPDSQENYNNSSQSTPGSVDRLQETGSLFVQNPETTASIAQKQPPISLEHEPMRPSFHPNPGNKVGQVNPSGTPWPDSLESCNNRTPSTPNVEDRLQETTSSTVDDNIAQTTTADVAQEQTLISLEYKPMRPFHQPNPSLFVGPTVPAGKPWPDSPDGYQNSNQSTAKPTNSNVNQTQPPISLEYEPMRPSFHPSPGNNVAQIIPPGKLWLDSSVGDKNQSTPHLTDKLQETNVAQEQTRATSSTVQKQSSISLEYKPARPFYHSNPGNNVGQIVPPGKPWPANPEGYKNSSQPTPSVVDRIQETSSLTTDVLGNVKPQTTPIAQVQTPIKLEYIPMRPFHAQNPGNYVGQIVQPGQPWPDSADGYQNFSQFASPPIIGDRFKESTTLSTTTVQQSEGFIWDSKTGSGTNTEYVLFTSNSDTEKTPTSTMSESTFESTTDEVATTDSSLLYTLATL